MATEAVNTSALVVVLSPLRERSCRRLGYLGREPTGSSIGGLFSEIRTLPAPMIRSCGSAGPVDASCYSTGGISPKSHVFTTQLQREGHLEQQTLPVGPAVGNNISLRHANRILPTQRSSPSESDAKNLILEATGISCQCDFHSAAVPLLGNRILPCRPSRHTSGSGPLALQETSFLASTAHLTGCGFSRCLGKNRQFFSDASLE